MHTQLEIASSGLRSNKTVSLAICWDKVKGRGVTAVEDITKGTYVCEYKYMSCYPLKEKKVVEQEYATNGEGCYILEVVAGGKRLCLDATDCLESWGRHINHLPRRQANIKMFRPLMVRGKWRVAFSGFLGGVIWWGHLVLSQCEGELQMHICLFGSHHRVGLEAKIWSSYIE